MSWGANPPTAPAAASKCWAVADTLAGGRLTRVLPEFETPSSGIYAVYPTNRLLTPLVRLFVEHVISDLRARGVPP
jgi:DNA-binding transcriptional LysR family regulator